MHSIIIFVRFHYKLDLTTFAIGTGSPERSISYCWSRSSMLLSSERSERNEFLRILHTNNGLRRERHWLWSSRIGSCCKTENGILDSVPKRCGRKMRLKSSNRKYGAPVQGFGLGFQTKRTATLLYSKEPNKGKD